MQTTFIGLRLASEIVDAIDAHAPFSHSVFIRLAVVEKLERDYGVKFSPESIRGSRGRRSDLVNPSPEKNGTDAGTSPPRARVSMEKP